WGCWMMCLCGLCGCWGEDRSLSSGPVKPSFPGVKLAVRALGDAAILTGLSAQSGEWEASRGGNIAIQDEPIRSLANLADLDLLIFPGQELGNLVDADLLEVIPNPIVLPSRPQEDESPTAARTESKAESPADAFQYPDLAPVFREQVTKYGAERMALPLGASALVLVYRRDAFSRQANLDAARAAGITLQPPSTWAQLDALAGFFEGRDWSGDGVPDHGITAVLGHDSEGLGNATYLARAASLAQHRDQYSFLFDADSMAPRIDSPPFVAALLSVTAWKRHGPPGMDKFDGPAACAAFRAGKAALLIDRAERARNWSGGHAVGVAPLPGSERVFEPLRQQWETSSTINAPSYLPAGGGWLVGVKRGLSGLRLDAALDLARYLASPENANRLRAEATFPMLPVRSSQMGHGLPDPTSAPDVDSRQWSGAVSRTLMAGRVVPGLRIPEAAGYLEDLARARVAALDGKDPETVLRDVSQAWAARTKARGTQRQLWHYRRSLNSLATLPQPPEHGK
ncbi:MAG: extracellular solute-binding protein, partial [Isosphaeraceae bacterium]